LFVCFFFRPSIRWLCVGISVLLIVKPGHSRRTCSNSVKRSSVITKIKEWVYQRIYGCWETLRQFSLLRALMVAVSRILFWCCHEDVIISVMPHVYRVQWSWVNGRLKTLCGTWDTSQKEIRRWGTYFALRKVWVL
jgi:hypothetical protein